MLRCPVCNSEEIEQKTTKHTLTFFGDVLIDTIICKKCGYKHSDILPTKQEEPKKISLIVESEKDLNIRVVKSSRCIIKIPEIGVEIFPGPFSQSYITNVEGILERIEEFINELSLIHI